MIYIDVSVMLFAVCATMGFGWGGCDGKESIGDSDVAINKTVDNLSTQEASDLCEYIVGLQEQPKREVDCGNDRIVTVGINPEDVQESIAICITQLMMVTASCTATVGDFETCFETSAAASDELICSPDLTPSCVPVAMCI